VDPKPEGPALKPALLRPAKELDVKALLIASLSPSILPDLLKIPGPAPVPRKREVLLWL
jgi:hypothetical protein